MKKRQTKSSPIFLFGVQRSGTTLLRLILDAHSQIAIPHESFVLIQFAKRLKDYNYLNTIEDRRQIVKDLLTAKGISSWQPKVSLSHIELEKCGTYAEVIDQIFSAYARLCGKSIWGDKTPSYVMDFHILNELFPTAKFIHLIRDGRDVAQSLENQSWGPDGFLNALRYWKEIVVWSRKMGRLLPQDRYLEIRYEDMVMSQEKTIREIMIFLGLPFEGEMLTKYNSKISKKLPAATRQYHTHITGTIDKNFVYKWRNSLPEIDQELAHQIAGDLFSELGYPSGNREISKRNIVIRRIYHWGRNEFKWRYKNFFKREKPGS